MSEEVKLTKKEAYEAMIHMLNDYYLSTGFDDLTDILSGGQYDKLDKPMDIGYWYRWEDAVKKVKEGAEPKRVSWKK